jgi:hypothetical protein
MFKLKFENTRNSSQIRFFGSITSYRSNQSCLPVILCSLLIQTDWTVVLVWKFEFHWFFRFRAKRNRRAVVSPYESGKNPWCWLIIFHSIYTTHPPPSMPRGTFTSTIRLIDYSACGWPLRSITLSNWLFRLIDYYAQAAGEINEGQADTTCGSAYRVVRSVALTICLIFLLLY